MSEDRLSELYRRHGPAIYSRCRRLLRDEALAEDATQEVFLRVLRHLEKDPGDVKALQWIYRISTNHCLNVLRDRSGQAEPMGELPEQASAHPEEALADRDLCLKVLGRTPEKLRAPALLHFVDGMDQGQVAETLGISRRTVINRLQEFTARARKLLARKEDE